MSVDSAVLRPGDVLVTATKDKGGWWIRLRSKLQGRPSLHNHVAAFTHCDSAGVPRGWEGRPGGFGQVDLRRYIEHPATISNAAQPGRSDADRERFRELALAMNAVPYDWRSIIRLGAELLDTRIIKLIEKRTEFKDGRPPSQVMCASALDWIYEELKWANPGGPSQTRYTDPDDWTAWIMAEGWK